jgi:phospholipid N-methyltransferase
MFRGNNWYRRSWGGGFRQTWGNGQRRAWEAPSPQALCYSTPEPLAREMVRLAGIRPGMRVLEPSAGFGAIARQVQATCPQAWLDVIEMQPALQTVLHQQGYRLVGTDALEYAAGPVYGAVVMNPPFRRRLDIWHILRCFDFVAPGGRLVTIASAESMDGLSTCTAAFRAWLREQSVWVCRLPGGPSGIFMQSSKPTQVETYLMVIQKAAAGSVAAAA